MELYTETDYVKKMAISNDVDVAHAITRMPKLLMTCMDSKTSNDVDSTSLVQIFDTILEIDPFVREVILEFYSNLRIFPKDTKKALVYVFGKMYEFSLMMINKFFCTSPVAWHKNYEVN